MNKEITNKAIDVLIKLHLITSEILGLDDYLLPSNTVENLNELIKSKDEEKIKLFITITDEYINNLKSNGEEKIK